eukprot:CAMPEP_0115554006 /NCGR_PEP_ID=MMETSP0271-20121206/97069_1 /TAXON_ID=71861 /ORGANISM="Scrippsiella trochoidea, Strain CCMP3099" /LENGTH=112 /DNA_ID=CAMNT_0002987715 /DNA_START=132 /DNA_END=466 /DNA_ORIENTATION=-
MHFKNSTASLFKLWLFWVLKEDGYEFQARRLGLHTIPVLGLRGEVSKRASSCEHGSMRGHELVDVALWRRGNPHKSCHDIRPLPTPVDWRERHQDLPRHRADDDIEVANLLA